MASANFLVSSLLDKMSASDKDFRFMATNDLMSELKKDTFRVDAPTETKMVSSVLKLLEDNNSEVQNLVVKCLPLLVNTISEAQLEEVINRLCQHLSAGKEELRDIANTGLKSVIVEIPVTSNVVGNLCKRLTPKLLSSIKTESSSYEVKVDALDLLGELLSRFGVLMVPFQQEILDALLLSLPHARPAIRKRTTVAIGHLVKNLGDKLFSTLVTHVISKLSSTTSADLLRSYMTCAASISRYVGKRLSKYMGELSPLLLSFIDKKDDELRESCLQTLEYLILQCQSEVSPIIPKVLSKSLELIKYDPNYADDENEDEEMEDEENEDEQSDGDYSDDDDMSWKVRRSSSRVISAIILTRTELLGELLKTTAPILVARFSEREENVRIENFNTFIVLLKRVGAVHKQSHSDHMETSDSSVTLLKELLPKISKSIIKSLKDKSQKTKLMSLTILKDLVLVLNGGFDSQIAQFAQPVANTLTNKASSSALKIECLSFLAAVFKSHTAAAFTPSLKTVVPPIVKATSEKYYKVASEALHTCSELVQALRPIAPQPAAISADSVTVVSQIYAADLVILGMNDVDQEVKEKAIYCLGHIIGHASDALSAETGKALGVLMEKVNNEITRLVAVKTLNFVARSPLNIDLSSILGNAVTELSTFLRKTNRSLKLSSIICLHTLIQTRGKDITEKQLAGVVTEVKSLINDSDLQILPLALNLLAQLLTVNKGSLPAIKSECLPSIFQTIKSPLLQGASLKSLLGLLGVMVSQDGALFGQLLTSLQEPLHAAENPLNLASSKQPFFSIAQCVAVICHASSANTSATVTKFIGWVKQADSSDSEKYLGLLTLGEIGKLSDLSAIGEVYTTVLHFFSDASEEVKSAAAFALGNLAVGNLNKFMPMILQEIKQQPKKQYLLLHSLKEVISQESQKDGAKNLIPFAEEVWQILFNNCESEEEGTRSAVAECLGKLTMINPQKYLPSLQQNLGSSSAFTRATVVIAIKFTFASTSQEFNALFKSLLEAVVPLIRDSDLVVRRVSLQALNSAALNKPAPVRELLPAILPTLYDATIVQKDLIKTVTMGPFKYEVDEGLDYRKAAYECMLTLLNTCHDIIGIFDFMERVVLGLQDKFDIKILSHLTLIQLCNLFPSAALQKIEDFVGHLETTINTKVKDTAVKQEIEKNEELVRSSIRAVVALSRLPEADANPRFAAFFKNLKGSEHKGKLETILAELGNDSGIDSMDTS